MQVVMDREAWQIMARAMRMFSEALSQMLPGVEVRFDSDIPGTAGHTQLASMVMAIHTRNTSAHLRISTGFSETSQRHLGEEMTPADDAKPVQLELEMN